VELFKAAKLSSFVICAIRPITVRCIPEVVDEEEESLIGDVTGIINSSFVNLEIRPFRNTFAPSIKGGGFFTMEEEDEEEDDRISTDSAFTNCGNKTDEVNKFVIS